jgi:hypothetical protein
MMLTNERHFRHELKYRIDFVQFQTLRKKLSIVLKPDQHAGADGSYHIRNLYFDDFRNTAFSEKEDGVLRRKKYRMRIYNGSDAVIKFELKAKINQYILKESAKLSREEADKIIVGETDFLATSENSLLKEFYFECRSNLYRPVVIVDYHRTAFVNPIGNVRITFDTELRTDLGEVSFFDANAPTIPIDNETGVILEVKFDEVLPQHIRGLFPNTIRPRSAIGKFAICRTQQICRLGDPMSGSMYAKKIKP